MNALKNAPLLLCISTKLELKPDLTGKAKGH